MRCLEFESSTAKLEAVLHITGIMIVKSRSHLQEHV